MMKLLGFISVVFIFLASMLACQFSGGPKPPRALTISLEESKAFEKAVQYADLIKPTGMVTLHVTESQMTSYIVFNLSRDLGEYLLDPQVFFEPNKIEIFGTLNNLIIPIEGRIVSEVSIVNQQPLVKIVSADFGFIPIPTSLLNSLSNQINQAISKNIQQMLAVDQIQSITVATGVMTISLKKK